MIMSKPFIFYVDGMHCISCSNTIEHALRQNNQYKIDYVHIDLTTSDPKKVTVIIANANETQESIWQQLKNHIEDVGFTCRENTYQPLIPQKKIEKKQDNSIQTIKNFFSSHWFLGGLGSLLGLTLLISFLVIPSLPLTVMIGLASLSTLFTLILGASSFYDAWKKFIKSSTLTMDSLFTISTICILIVSVASFFVPGLPMMFEAGLLIYGFRHIGLAIEETLKEKIHPGRFQDKAPQNARLVLESGIYNLPLSAIQTKHLIKILPGEIIPLDGECEQDSSIYNTIIKGSSVPQHYLKGDKVLAGMRLAEDAQPLELRVLNTSEHSYLARLDAAIEQSLLEKAPLELKTQKLLNYFIPSVIALAIICGIGLSFFFPAAIVIQSVLSILVSACPCTLGLIIPLAVKTGMHKAGEYGVYFKNAKVLQEAEQIDTIVFDLNGTLTQGIPSVKNYNLLTSSQLKLTDFFNLCASLEHTSHHPFAKAINFYAQAYKPTPYKVTEINTSHHAGITGFIKGVPYAISGSKLMQELKIDTAKIENEIQLEAGDSIVYLAKEKELLGYLVLTDPLRKDALNLVQHLQDQGKDIYLCTGSDENTAQRYAKYLGIKNIHANYHATTLKEQDKSKPSLIKNLQQQNKKVAMIGDAANDSHALAASNLGIAVLSQNSDELIQKYAGAVIQKDSLMPIASLFEISKHTVSNINQNLLITTGYNAAAFLISAGLRISPALGAFLMIVQAGIVLGNVYRFKKQALINLEKETLQDDAKNSSFKKMHYCSNLNSSSNKMNQELKQPTEEIKHHLAFKQLNNKPKIEEQPEPCCALFL